jgi:hypothetical protein
VRQIKLAVPSSKRLKLRHVNSIRRAERRAALETEELSDIIDFAGDILSRLASLPAHPRP